MQIAHHTKPSDYDAVFTGDLGLVGSRSLYDLLSLENIDLEPKHYDCGMMIFDLDVHCAVGVRTPPYSRGKRYCLSAEAK